MNSVNLIGRLTRDPELSYGANNQTPIAKFTLAVDRPVSSQGEKKTDFIRIVVFGKQAENCSRYLSKGRQCAVEGRIQTGSYQNRDGVTVYTTDVVANRVEFLGGKSDGGYQKGGSASKENAFYEDDIPDSFQAAEDDLPF